MIGGGAYGEVWLARGVTGALRAVKVVWREDFEDARGFEREFEGILKFEPMSRDHPALVNILHVGRSPDGVSFYYYVMELGDDVTSGQDINPIEYEPRTLRADNQQSAGVQWEVNQCIDVGLRLAEALDHMHARGLAHRDVKPSNVIFVNGRAKLADIGLVAMSGQRTFVGTEGFVPPEGPGSAQADVYSLGKVLYEIATGKDRLAFPELPDVMPGGADRKRWLELNKIICDICEPRISRRKISTAGELADALRRLQRGKRRRQSGRAVWMTTLILTGFSAWAGWELVKDSDWMKSLHPVVKKDSKPTIAHVKVVSIPEGAEVYDGGGKLLGTTSLLIPVTVGEHYFFRVRHVDYKPQEFEGVATVQAVSEPEVLQAALLYDKPPVAGEKWLDHLGGAYLPVGDEHVGADFPVKEAWQRYARETKRNPDDADFIAFSQNGQAADIVLCKPADAQAYCRWIREQGVAGGYLTEDFEISPVIETGFESPALSERARRDGLKPFHILVKQIAYGEISLVTDPADVEIYMNPLNEPANRVSMGSSNHPIPKVRPGVWQLYLVHEGYKPLSIEVKVGESEKVTRPVKLEKNLGVVFGKAWENGIGMKFAPLGQELMVSIWETRVRDYDLFVKESGHAPARPPDFPQTPDHPVVSVSRDDAQKFCEWLTKREQKMERIARTHLYRLPTDLEWSTMVGLQEEEGISPGWRDGRKQRVYPWGETWLRGEVTVGNFADVSAASVPGVAIDRTISGYDDKFPYTAPVGSFPANSYGIFDLTGNVQEWVEDDYSKLGAIRFGVLRGGGWTTYQPENLLSGSRNAPEPSYSEPSFGFRVVLAKEPSKSE